MHVLILNQTFYPDVAATAQHMWDLARFLEKKGHTITAITSQSRYGSSERFNRTHEQIGNITIHRVRQTAFGKVHNLGRMADFLSFYASAMWQMTRIRTPDVILTLTSPPMIGLLGVVHKQFAHTRRIALVNHVMDLYPDAAVAMGVLKPASPITRLMKAITRKTFAASDALIALGQDMRDRIVDQYLPNDGSRPIHIVQPWSDKDEICPMNRHDNSMRRELGLHDAFVLLYSGNFGQAHDVDTIIGAIRAMTTRKDIRWCFTGGGKGMTRLKDCADRERWPNVVFLPYQPRERLNELLNLADVHLISQSPAFTGIVVPSKLFGIMAAGKASIMVGPADAEASRILIDHDAGIVCNPGDVNSLQAAIERLQRDDHARLKMGENARQSLCRKFECQVACNKIETILLQAIEQANRAHD